MLDLQFGEPDLLLVARHGASDRLEDLLSGRGQPLVDELSELLNVGHDGSGQPADETPQPEGRALISAVLVVKTAAQHGGLTSVNVTQRVCMSVRNISGLYRFQNKSVIYAWKSKRYDSEQDCMVSHLIQYADQVAKAKHVKYCLDINVRINLKLV